MSVSTAIDSSRRSDARRSDASVGAVSGTTMHCTTTHSSLPRCSGVRSRWSTRRRSPPRRPAARPANDQGGAAPVRCRNSRRRSREPQSSEVPRRPARPGSGNTQQRPSRTGGDRQAHCPVGAADSAGGARSAGRRVARTGQCHGGDHAADRYAAAHLAALRAAAAVLAARARPVRGRRGSAWELISKVAPEFCRMGRVLRRRFGKTPGGRGRDPAAGVTAGGRRHGPAGRGLPRSGRGLVEHRLTGDRVGANRPQRRALDVRTAAIGPAARRSSGRPRGRRRLATDGSGLPRPVPVARPTGRAGPATTPTARTGPAVRPAGTRVRSPAAGTG